MESGLPHTRRQARAGSLCSWKILLFVEIQSGMILRIYTFIWFRIVGHWTVQWLIIISVPTHFESK